MEASIQYSTFKICSHIAEKFDVTFSKEFVCTLGKLAFEQTGLLAQDLELFAKYDWIIHSSIHYFYLYIFSFNTDI